MRDGVYIVFFVHDAGGRKEEAEKGTSGTVALSIPGAWHVVTLLPRIIRQPYKYRRQSQDTLESVF